MRSAVFLVFLVTLCGCHHHPAQVQSQLPQPVPVQAAKTPEPASTPQAHTSGGGVYCRFSDITGPVKNPLMIAAWQGDFQKVKELTEANTDLNAKFPYCGSEGHEATPLINAIEGKGDQQYRRRAGMPQSSNYEEVIEFLLHHGASPNVTLHGFSPLHAASEFGQLKTVQMLLRYGANLESRYEGETPLLMAAHSPEGNTVIPELVAAGADINALDDLGNNAVAIAAGQHNLEGVKLFISLGVDGCAQDHDGRTALYWASLNQQKNPGRKDAIALLLQKCGS